MASSSSTHEGKGKRMALFICWFLGMGTLMPLSTLLTVEDYYYKVFPAYHPSRVLTLVYQPFAVITSALLAYHEAKVDIKLRTMAGFVIFALSTLSCIMLDLGTSGKGGIGPYIGLCVVVGAFGVAGGHTEGGLVGELSFMLPEFVQSYLGGLAASGALTSALRLITKAAFDTSANGLRKGALLFLAISTSIEFLSILLYALYFPKLPIVKYFRGKGANNTVTSANKLELEATSTNQVDNTAEVEDRLTIKQILFQNWDYFLDLYLIYVVTLSIFPGFLYENTGKHALGEWYPIVLIGVFNLCDLIGRYTPLIEFSRLESRKGLIVAIIARCVFIPAIYFTAKYASQGWMIVVVGLLGWTTGHLTVCVMTAAPKRYNKGSEQNALGNLLVLFLFGGVFSGACLDWMWDL